MNLARFFAILNLSGLTCGVAGGLFLFYSLTLRTTSFRLVKVGPKNLAICFDDKVVVAGYGGPLVVSDDPCPDLKGTGPTPQIVAERPALASWGVWLIVLGFALQLPVAVLAVLGTVSP
jgi:hypothetical protein